MLTHVIPYGASMGMGGSTDVGDVSWIAPTAQVGVTCLPQRAPPHSWQWVAAGKSHLMHQGLLNAGKIIAMTAYDILTTPQLLPDAVREHEKNLEGETYHSIIPDGTLPR